MNHLPFDEIEEKQAYVAVAGTSSTASRKGNHFHIPRIGYGLTLCDEGYLDVAYTEQKATCPICLANYERFRDKSDFTLAKWKRYYGEGN